MTASTGPDEPGSPTRDDGANEAVAQRLRLRYPPPLVSTKVKAAIVTACVAVALTWLVWAALVHAQPAAAGQVSSFTVTSDTSMEVGVTVQRRDATQAVACRVLAQSTDFQPVAEVEVTAPPSELRLTEVDVTLTTLRRATSAKVTDCRTVG